MLIQVNSDNHITGSAEIAARIEATLAATLGRFGDRVTRIEVHLKDDNSVKGGERDKECTLEARLAGLAPIAVTQLAPTVDLAVEGAAEKLVGALDRAEGRAAKARPGATGR